MAAGAPILDLRVASFSKLDFYIFIRYLTHESMGLDTKIEPLACLLFMLQPIYQNWVMAAVAAILDLVVTSVTKLNFYSFSKFLTHENIGL
jgi:hypothetical protein